MHPLELDGQSLTLKALVDVARGERDVILDERARGRMAQSRAWVEDAAEGRLPGGERAIYGVNTGFGSLSQIRIQTDEMRQLSRNLIRSHAAAVGSYVAPEVARATVLLRANALSRGASGCRPVLVEALLDLLREGITPALPSQGSCGSSGDLAPLSHLGLIIAHAPSDPHAETGSAWVNGRLVSGKDALALKGLKPLELGPKEGLAINNGAQLTTAIAALACYDAMQLVLLAEIAAAMAVEALQGVRRAFHPAVHALRPYVGARACASNLLTLLNGSELVDSVPGRVQDAYSLRCSPQVLGAARDGIAHATAQVEVELNAVTDNPVILPEGDSFGAFSAGLFHGESVGMAADYLKIAVCEVASISERRLFRLITGNLSGRLPAQLVGKDRPGVGLFGLQTTAAALVSENKSLAWPASVDSIPTCEDQEDHVAMSTTAARRASEVVVNARRVVAIELFAAARALRYRKTLEPTVQLGCGTGAALEALEECLEGSERESPSELIVRVEEAMDSGSIEIAAQHRCGKLYAVGEGP